MPHQKNDTQYVVMYDLNLIVILSLTIQKGANTSVKV